MSYSIAIGSIYIASHDTPALRTCSCNDAQKGCMPPFVFSITGQVSFRTSLDHIVTCRTRQCASLRKKVREGMHAKLQWLFEEQALLGCVHVQPFLYQEKRAVNIKQPKQFSIVANHLAHCPNESCSRLRRAVLLSIRDKVSPASRNNE